MVAVCCDEKENEMGFFDDLGKKVADAGQKTMQKTKEISDVARINSLITQEENKINNMYYQIGKLYVSMHRNDCEEEFFGMLNSIAELEKNIKEYKKQIQDVKGIQHCLKCGAEVPRGVAFCSSCGNPMAKIETQESAAGYIRCLNCGVSVKKGMRFCTSCGKPITQSGTSNEDSIYTESEVEPTEKDKKKNCPNCGEKIMDDSLFCTECGTKL